MHRLLWVVLVWTLAGTLLVSGGAASASAESAEAGWLPQDRVLVHGAETCGVGLPIASQTGADPAVLLGRNAHGDIGYLHDSTGAVSTTSVFDPFGQLVGNDATGSMLGFQGDYTDATTGDVWMGARWYRPGTGGFVSRDTVFGQLQTPMSVNRYTYALGDPLGRWDPDGRCSKPIWVSDASVAGPETCTDDLMNVVSVMEQRTTNLSQRFMAGMLAGLRTVAENPIVSLIAPGADCAILALDRAQDLNSDGTTQAGCMIDLIPGGKIVSKVVGGGVNTIRGGRAVSNAADRAGDAAQRVDDVPALTRVEAPSVSRVAPEPPVAKAPEAKSFDPPDPSTRRAGPDPDANGGASSSAIEIHPFSSGASHITTTRNLDRFPESTTFGGPDGLFVAPTRQIDDLLASGASRPQIEATLGLNKGSLAGGDLVRIDIADPFGRRLRLPDPKLGNVHHRPGTGLTTGNLNEAVIDSPSKSDPRVLFSLLGDRK